VPQNRTTIFFLVALALLVFSVILGVTSIYNIATGEAETRSLIDETFHLSPNEQRRQGIGNFHGNGTVGDGTIVENLTLKVENLDVFVRNFSVISYGATHYNSTSENISYNLTTGADYYEAVFWTDGNNSGRVHFEVSITQPEVTYPYAWLTAPAKVLFLVSIAAITLTLLKNGQVSKLKEKITLPSIGRTDRRLLVAFLLASLAFWLTLTALNSNPLGTFENWYTDHARDTYVGSLFLKDGLDVFSQPLYTLASQDSSRYIFVTWPEMPNLYPIGSIAVFLPFGVSMEAGVNAVLVYKLEIALFLVFAHACLYVFLSRYWVQTDFPRLAWKNASENLKTLRHGDWKQQKQPMLREYFLMTLKLIGVYVIYASLVPFAANGMFDSIAILFLLMAVTVFLSERYDYFILLVGVSVLFKYQTAIFLFPLIVVAVVKLLENNNLKGLIKNRAVVLAVICAVVSGFTAVLSAPYLMQTRPELVMNAINAFSPHAQIPWSWQTELVLSIAGQAQAVLGVLAATLFYSIYMFNRNRLLSVSALFLLLPTFCLPYFQNWYLPFMFAYALIPRQKEEFGATMIWLIFIVFMLSFGGSGLNPQVLVQHFESMIRSSMVGLGV
jgi:hypothetical protein